MGQLNQADAEEAEEEIADLVYDFYSELEVDEIIDLDKDAGLSIRLFSEFIRQASEPGDQLVKVTVNEGSGMALFILCQPGQVDELRRIETVLQRERVSKGLKGPS